MTPLALTRLQQVGLVVLRTLVGWHFLYEGFTKVLAPAWSRAGAPLARWTAAGYLRASSGPFAELLPRPGRRSLAPVVDMWCVAGLVLVGLSLMLGLFTQTGVRGRARCCWRSSTSRHAHERRGPGGRRGRLPARQQEPDRGGGGRWWSSSFRTGRIAGLDLFRRRGPGAPPAEADAMNLTPEQQELGRRNFLQAVATTPALAALGAAAAAKGRCAAGRCAWATSASGGEGRVLLEHDRSGLSPRSGLLRHQPAHSRRPTRSLAKAGVPQAKHYERLEGDDPEGGPRGGHARVAALAARRDRGRDAWRRASTCSARR